AAWRTETGTDTNSTSADPLFVSTSDLHISSSSSPVNNAGTPVTGFTTDFDGDTRDASTPDIGADELTTMQFSSATYSVREDVAGGVLTVTVSRTAGTANAASVNYATSDNTATGGATCGAGVDYVTTSGTLNFAAGDTSKTFNVSICNDSVYEGDETF